MGMFDIDMGMFKTKKKSARSSFDGPCSNILNNFNLRKFGGSGDIDYDGILNRFDCQPKNPMRQDVNKIFRERISNLPISYVNKIKNSSDGHDIETYNLMKYDGRDKNILQTKRSVQNMIKHNPYIIKEIENRQVGGVKAPIYFSKDNNSMVGDSAIAIPIPDNKNKINKTNIIYPLSGNQRVSSVTLTHELKHADQNAGMDMNKYNTEFDKQHLADNAPSSAYFSVPVEKEAEEYAIKQRMKFKYGVNDNTAKQYANNVMGNAYYGNVSNSELKAYKEGVIDEAKKTRDQKISAGIDRTFNIPINQYSSVPVNEGPMVKSARTSSGMSTIASIDTSQKEELEEKFGRDIDEE